MQPTRVATTLVCAALFASAVAAVGQLDERVDPQAWPLQVERSREVDVLHYRIELALDDRGKRFDGVATVTFAALAEGLQRCTLDADGYTVAAATDESGHALAFTHVAGTMVVTLPRPLGYGERYSVTVRYAGQAGERGLRFCDASESAPAQISSYTWPEEARFIFPCFDYPNDKATTEMLVTVRQDWQALSNGVLVAVTADPEHQTRTFHWLQQRPHPTYGAMVAAGPYVVVEGSRHGLPVRYWVYPAKAARAMGVFGRTPAMIRFFGQRFGVPYPWAKYDQVTVGAFGGGLECTSATLLGDGVMDDDNGGADGLIAHELAHQWWGDLVTERTWSHVWLSESFATYSEYLWQRHDRGEDEGAANLEDKKARYLNEARNAYTRAIVHDRYRVPWDIMDAHAYPKGACVLHMLRIELGDDAFFRVFKAFLERFAAASADTRDLETTIKDVTGQNLEWFFQQWLYRPGHPRLAVRASWDKAARLLRLVVTQTQEQKAGVGLFRLPVTVGITTAAGHSAHRLVLSEAVHELALPCADEPKLVRFDEGNWLLAEVDFERSVPELLYQLEHDDVVGRAWAASQLGTHGNGPGVQTALLRTAGGKGFWFVRRAALRALAEIGDPVAFATFRAVAEADSAPLRSAALEAIARVPSPELAGFLRRRLAAEHTLRLKMTVLHALGECGTRADLVWLAELAASPRSAPLKRAAEAAIARINERLPKE
jgi:aminopeptidase N